MKAALYVLDPWDCSFGWFDLADKKGAEIRLERNTTWITDSGWLSSQIAMCVMKAAVRDVGVRISDIPSRAIVLVAQPKWADNSKEYYDKQERPVIDLNNPKGWCHIENIRRHIQVRWKMISLGVVSTIWAGLYASSCRDGIVISALRPNQLSPATNFGMSGIQAYVCRGLRIEKEVSRVISPSSLIPSLVAMLASIAPETSLTKVIVLTDVDSRSEEPEGRWGIEELDTKMAEVINDIRPKEFAELVQAVRKNSETARLNLSLVTPTDLVNAGMQMACDDSFNHLMWVHNQAEFYKMRPGIPGGADAKY